MVNTYYCFWLESYGESSCRTVRMYKGKPDTTKLKEDVDRWVENQSCYKVGSFISYGYDRILRLPKNRAECLKSYRKACKALSKAKEKCAILRGLFSHPPYSGS